MTKTNFAPGRLISVGAVVEQAFNLKVDPYTQVAMHIWGGVGPITREQRQKAKAIAYGHIYGFDGRQTGRLSSGGPNVQVIRRGSPEAKRIRDAFTKVDQMLKPRFK